ncbi:MAG TPA: ABC transporter permease, partial [Cyclobacteriaceae bacterium]
MLLNYFVVAFRNIKNNLVFSCLNSLCLSVGMACCLVVFLLAYQEYTYETQHEKVDRIYRIVNRQTEGTKLSVVAFSQGLLAPELAKNFAEVEEATRVGFIQSDVLVDDKAPEKQRIMAVDPSYFKIFTIPFKQLPGRDTLEMDGVLISEKAAVRLFGKKNPIGERVTINDIHLKVSGVFEDFTLKSNLITDFIISFAWIEKTDSKAQLWNYNSYYNYVLMPETFDKQAFHAKMNEFIHRFTPASWKSYEYFLQPIRMINLHAGVIGNPRGTIGKIIVHGFVTLGVIILLLASFNYMNMATARSARRVIEVGIRKVVGAQRSQLVRQFLAESFVLCGIGFFMAILWADLALQFFNHYTGFGLSLNTFFGDVELVCWLIGAFLLITIGSGVYPAFFLSRFMPAAILKGRRSSKAGSKIRRGLVIFQFALTSTLVVMVIIVHKQVKHLRSIDVGYNTEQLLLFTADRNKEVTIESFKAELLKLPGVKQISVTSNFPSGRASSTSVWESGKA